MDIALGSRLVYCDSVAKRRIAPLSGGPALLIILAGCAATPHQRPEPTPGAGGDLVTREEIDRAAAQTVWDVLRCCTTLRLIEDRAGNPAGIEHRGRNSMFLEETPLIIIDGIRTSELSTLDFMLAKDLLAIRVLSGAEAGFRYGSGADNGVIEIYTRHR